jgi:hypothetical protein
MAATATTILGTKTLPYVESDRALGRNLAQTAGHYLALPMTGMGLMLVATALIIAIVRADLSVSLRGGFDAGDKAAFETLGALLPGFMFLGFAMLFAGISFSIARILGVFRVGGGQVQDAVGRGFKTPLMPPTAWIFLGGMMMAMMILIAAFAGHVYAAFQAHDAWIDATGPAGAVQHLVGRAETWATWLEGLRRFGVGLYLTSIGFGLATIIQVIRFQSLRIRELATETRREG